MADFNKLLKEGLTKNSLSPEQIKRVRSVLKKFLEEEDDPTPYIEIIGLFEYITTLSAEEQELARENQIIEIEQAEDFESLIQNADNQINNKIALQEEIKATRQKTELPVIDKFCKYCGVVRKIAFRSVQTRGGDEAATIFYTCTVCNTQWRSKG